MLSDFVVRIKMAHLRKNTYVVVKKSRFIKKVLECLLDNGYIRGFSESDKFYFQVYLKYEGDKPVLRYLEYIIIKNTSYIGIRDYEYIAQKGSVYLITTNKGLIITKNSFLKDTNILVGGCILLKIE